MWWHIMCHSHTKTVQLLLANYADPNRRDFDGLTPFFDLAESDRIVRILSATNTVE